MGATPTATNLPNETKAVQSSLFRLLLELRRMIYWQSIIVGRRPTPEEVHQRNFGAIWEDILSPFLGINKQVRAEVFDLLKKRPFTMRVTSYGAEFDMLGLSCFIAQQRPISYCDLPFLMIDIWPPHPDRPIEMYYIRYRVREIREELRAASGVQELIIYFTEKSLAKWTQDGGPRHDLSRPGETDPLQSDIAKMLDHFACVTNITKARIRPPPSLECNETK